MQTAYYPSDAMAIIPSDTTELGLCGFYVGVTGDVAIKTPKGNTVTFKACPAGFKINIQAIRIMATNTTATNIVGLLP